MFKFLLSYSVLHLMQQLWNFLLFLAYGTGSESFSLHDHEARGFTHAESIL